MSSALLAVPTASQSDLAGVDKTTPVTANSQHSCSRHVHSQPGAAECGVCLSSQASVCSVASAYLPLVNSAGCNFIVKLVVLCAE